MELWAGKEVFPRRLEIITAKIAKETINSPWLNASGIRWIKASPKSDPTEKLTKSLKALLSFFSLKKTETTPTNDTRLTKTTLEIV